MPDKFHWLRRLWDSRAVRYLIFGALTVVCNLVCFSILTGYTQLGLDASNALSIIAALLFAYGTNTRFVFRSKCSTTRERAAEFLRFLSARLFTMALEFAGVHVLAGVLLLNGFLSKLVVQAAVIVLNYVFSKWMVYTNSQ